MPEEPKDLVKWSRIVNLFWELPAYPELAIRLMIQHKRELRFLKLAKEYDI